MFFWFGLPTVGWTQIELSDLFSDHMVLQRELPIPIWGTAASDATLEISIGNNNVITTADYFGNWEAKLPSMNSCANEKTSNSSAKLAVDV